MTPSASPFPRPTPTDVATAVVPDGWTGPEACPMEIDVGCHKGLFLVEMAGRFPERNFLGVEYQAERVEKTRRKIRALGLSNAEVVCAEGFEVLQKLGAGSVDHIHVLFPDPWPKRRHHNRRLVQKEFLAVCLKILKTGGLLRLVTDDESYALAMQGVARTAIDFVALPEEDRVYPLTEFQKKFLADARPVHVLVLRKGGGIGGK